MARSKTEIKAEITASFMANEVLAAKYGFAVGASFAAEFSLVSLENIIFDIISFKLFIQEQIFNKHKQEIKEMIANDKAHRASWYVTRAKAFQYGFDLIYDTDQYDNTNYTDEQIQASRIIKYAAVTKSSGHLLIKIATESDGVLTPIAEPQRAAFNAYIDEIADFGVRYTVVNHLPDILLLNIQLFCDPLVIDANGMSILKGNYPVEEAIQEFLKNLPFNGELVLFDLESALKKVEGIRIPNLIKAETQSINPNTGIYEQLQVIDVKKIPVSGYFTIPNFDNLNYVV
jgi:hypothetical protein